MLAGMVVLAFGILVRVNCAFTSAGDSLKAVYRFDLTAEGLEPDHDNLHAM